LRQVAVDDVTVALKLLVDRRDGLGRARTEALSRLHHLLLELVPGGAKQFLSAPQARALLTTVRPRDIVGRTRRQLASELITEVAVIDKKIKAANAQLTDLVESTGSTLQQLNGIGPSGAARLLGDIGDIGRFASRDHFASWSGTAPIDASSGDHRRHRLSLAGNRRINRVLHIMAIVQLRNDTEGRAYYRRKLAAGKSPMEAMGSLKRRLSNVVHQQMVIPSIFLASMLVWLSACGHKAAGHSAMISAGVARRWVPSASVSSASPSGSVGPVPCTGLPVSARTCADLVFAGRKTHVRSAICRWPITGSSMYLHGRLTQLCGQCRLVAAAYDGDDPMFSYASART
jgi:hypothetical protein